MKDLTQFSSDCYLKIKGKNTENDLLVCGTSVFFLDD